MLTDRQLLKAAPGMHADGGGLYLRVSPKGKKAWVRRSQKAGKDSWQTIGVYPGMSLADARRAAQNLTVAVSMTTALNAYMEKLQVARPEQVELLVAPLYALPLAVAKAQAVAILQEKADSAPVMANRMLTRWQDFFNFCVQNGWLEQNPLAGVQRKFVGGKETSRKHTLPWREIHSLYTGANRPVHFCLFFVLVTGLRSSEALWVLRAKQTEKIPTKENPEGTHWIPRTPLVRWFLHQKITPVASKDTMANYLLRRFNGPGIPGVERFVPHDLRRTFSTLLNELGVAPHIVEKMLDHKLPGVMATYNHAEYRAERYAAQRLWERELLRRRKKTPD